MIGGAIIRLRRVAGRLREARGTAEKKAPKNPSIGFDTLGCGAILL
jgi:hypothetical protein